MSRSHTTEVTELGRRMTSLDHVTGSYHARSRGQGPSRQMRIVPRTTLLTYLTTENKFRSVRPKLHRRRHPAFPSSPQLGSSGARRVAFGVPQPVSARGVHFRKPTRTFSQPEARKTGANEDEMIADKIERTCRRLAAKSRTGTGSEPVEPMVEAIGHRRLITSRTTG